MKVLFCLRLPKFAASGFPALRLSGSFSALLTPWMSIPGAAEAVTKVAWEVAFRGGADFLLEVALSCHLMAAGLMFMQEENSTLLSLCLF